MLTGTIAAPEVSAVVVVVVDAVVTAAVAVSVTAAVVSAALLASEVHAARATTAERDSSVGTVVKRFIEGSSCLAPDGADSGSAALI
jgi:hypothetical protein